MLFENFDDSAHKCAHNIAPWWNCTACSNIDRTNHAEVPNDNSSQRPDAARALRS